jgi:hypothetical protein
MKLSWLTLCVLLAFNCETRSEESSDPDPSDPETLPGQGQPPKKSKAPHPYALSYVFVRHLAKIEEDLYKTMWNYEQVLKLRLKIVSKYVRH